MPELKIDMGVHIFSMKMINETNLVNMQMANDK